MTTTHDGTPHDGRMTTMDDQERLKAVADTHRKLLDMHATQGRDGNWNYSPYMRGLFNGLELALAIIQDRPTRLRNAPANYLSDDRDKAYPDYLSGARVDHAAQQAVTVYGIGISEWDRYQQMVQELHAMLTAFAAPFAMPTPADDDWTPPPSAAELLDGYKHKPQPITRLADAPTQQIPQYRPVRDNPQA